MVQLDSGQHLAQLLDRTQNISALRSMSLHDLELFGRERAGFLQNPVFNADFAYIV